MVADDFAFPERLSDRITALKPTRHVQLRKFTVLSQLQGMGIGRLLLRAAMQPLGSRISDDSSHPAASTDSSDKERTLLHFDARIKQRGFYERLGFEVLDPEVFLKYGPTGKEVGVEHIRMGAVLG